MPDPTGLLTESQIEDIAHAFYDKYSGKGLSSSEIYELHHSEFFEEMCKAQHSADALAKEQAVVEERKRIIGLIYQVSQVRENNGFGSQRGWLADVMEQLK